MHPLKKTSIIDINLHAIPSAFNTLNFMNNSLIKNFCCEMLTVKNIDIQETSCTF